MRAVLISIQPKWCEKIASGEKTIEVRKTRPKIKTPFKCYIYATKKEYLQHICKKGEYIFCDDHSVGKFDENIFVKNKHDWQGKVIGEFICNKIDEFLVFENGSVQYWNYHELDKSCLAYEELSNYIGKDKKGYGWHISALKIYDKPKELGEFFTPMGKRPSYMIERPPQSWCYVEEL